MEESMYIIIAIGSIGIYLLITLEIIAKKDFNFSFLNPVTIYEEWCYTLNWFGIGIVIVFTNILFLPYAIIYWVVKLIYFIITVGRKKKENK